MFSGQFAYWRARRPSRCAVNTIACVAAALILLAAHNGWTAQAVSIRSNNPKHVIGATATIKEVSTGLSFPARIDTGAQSCSLHVEKIQVADESPIRPQNIGKKIRFLVQGSSGKSAWIETTIAAAVRVKSAALGTGEVDRRYKVRLTLQWKDFRKEVLVTLNDRTDMEFPLLIGRNYLRGDFLVDVEKDG
jgi:hypothetical protein